VIAPWGAAAKAFLIALVLSPIIRDIFRSYNVVDHPGRRKVHAYPVPRLGGIAIGIACAAGLLPSAVNGDSGASQILPGAAMIFALGAVDDLFNLKALHKMAGQAVAAGLVYWGGLRFETLAGLALPVWIGLPLTIFWLLLATNALNLIDGLDGLCAGIGSVAAMAFYFVGRIQDNFGLQQAALVLAAALLGFIGYNWNPATMFLGDSGALLIGFLLGCFGLMWAQHAPGQLSSAAVPIMILGIPLLDLGLSIIRRFLKHQPLFAADRLHMHHRLLDRGFSARRSALILCAAAMLAGAFALMLIQAPSEPWRWILIAVFCALICIGTHQLRYAEFDVARDLLLRGGFRRTLEKQAWVRNLGQALDRCRTDEEWWQNLAHSVSEAGWISMKWIRNEARTGSSRPLNEPDTLRASADTGSVVRTSFSEMVLQERVWSDQPPAWSFMIELAGDEKLRIEGPLQSEGPSMDLIAFADMVRASFSLRQQARQAALSS
jgi:UDP-GlcNAc:undecaprenyl-phosphate GlcNAc-1-phosphate transferase